VGEVFIDRYEYPNQAGAQPATRIDFEEAVTLCVRVGKHLCSEAEWESACAGPEHLRYGWGNEPEAGRCLDQSKRARRPAVSGRFQRCATPGGVFDLLGNVAEWTSTPLHEGAPQRVVRGGSFSQSDAKLSCEARDYLLPGQGGAANLGFRCCL
jgi:formylglycine-generating enzyme required for sulfatase activity